jgi:hypothetical protein
MSGFWVDKNKFVTCAHFLEVVTDTDVPKTVELLKNAVSSVPRARVSTAARPGNKSYGCELWIRPPASMRSDSFQGSKHGLSTLSASTVRQTLQCSA